MRCPYCAAIGQEKICEYCGSELINEEEKPVVVNNYYIQKPKDGSMLRVEKGEVYVGGKNKTVALLLCIFGGMYGLHNFYVGKVGKGVAYIFTFGLFGIGWIVDIITIITGSFTDANGYTLDGRKMDKSNTTPLVFILIALFLIGVMAEADEASIRGVVIVVALLGAVAYRLYTKFKNK